MNAPSPFLKANLDVLYRATMEARLLAWRGEQNGQLSEEECHRLAELMDVVHNIPLMLQRWETVDEARHREFLRAYEERWKGTASLSLLEAYETRLGGYRECPASC